MTPPEPQRVGDLTRAYRDDVINAHPRAGVTADLLARIEAEASANPQGRIALLRRCGLPYFCGSIRCVRADR